MKRIFQHPSQPLTGKKYWRSLGQVSGTPGGASADVAPEVVLTSGDFVSVYPGEPLPLPASTPPAVLGGFLAATESVSFEMPVPAPGQFQVVLPPVTTGIGPAGGGSSTDAAGPADPGFGTLPPIAQQSINATATRVQVNVTFP